jgi:hypothetical protein
LLIEGRDAIHAALAAALASPGSGVDERVDGVVAASRAPPSASL